MKKEAYAKDGTRHALSALEDDGTRIYVLIKLDCLYLRIYTLDITSTSMLMIVCPCNPPVVGLIPHKLGVHICNDHPRYRLPFGF